MLFCDLQVNSLPVWNGLPCEHGSPLGIYTYDYVNFIGNLIFVDTQGRSNPSYDGLTGRFVLLYVVPGQPNVQVPLQAIPAQTFNIVLGGQNCTISIYEADVDQTQAILTPNPQYAETGYWTDYAL